MPPCLRRMKPVADPERPLCRRHDRIVLVAWRPGRRWPTRCLPPASLRCDWREVNTRLESHSHAVRSSTWCVVCGRSGEPAHCSLRDALAATRAELIVSQLIGSPTIDAKSSTRRGEQCPDGRDTAA